jgi:hypothetical protein
MKHSGTCAGRGVDSLVSRAASSRARPLGRIMRTAAGRTRLASGARSSSFARAPRALRPRFLTRFSFDSLKDDCARRLEPRRPRMGKGCARCTGRTSVASAASAWSARVVEFGRAGVSATRASVASGARGSLRRSRSVRCSRARSSCSGALRGPHSPRPSSVAGRSTSRACPRPTRRAARTRSAKALRPARSPSPPTAPTAPRTSGRQTPRKWSTSAARARRRARLAVGACAAPAVAGSTAACPRYSRLRSSSCRDSSETRRPNVECVRAACACARVRSMLSAAHR